MRRLPVDEMTNQDAALTLFFWCAYIFALVGITAGTVAEYDAMLATYRIKQSNCAAQQQCYATFI